MKKGVPAAPEPPHGSHERYVSRYFKCHEACCREANKKYMQDYRMRRKNNGGKPLRVDARRDVAQGVTKHSTQFTNSYIGETNG